MSSTISLLFYEFIDVGNKSKHHKNQDYEEQLKLN